MLGIDLGTTRSVVAFVNAKGEPETIRNREGEFTTPSVVLFEEDCVSVGKEALKAVATVPEKVAKFAKREMGKDEYPIKFGDQCYSPELIQAAILERLRLDAEARLGCTLRKAVISVPAYFNEPKRRATIDAGLLAGLKVEAIINEPTAAALAFGLESKPYGSGVDPIDGQPCTVLVYDLGGGTFDVSVVTLDGTQFVVKATDGNARLGGMDWDKCLAAWLDDQFDASHACRPSKTLVGQSMLMRESEEIKHALSARNQCKVRIAFDGFQLRTEITRTQFEELSAHLLDRTRFTVRHLLKGNALTWDAIDKIILVGGSTRMPQVRELLQRESGKVPEFTVSADEAVAHGAAIYAASLNEVELEDEKKTQIRVTDVNAHDLGVLGYDRETKRRCNHVMIKRNTSLPASNVSRFETIRENQRSVAVEVVEGGDKRGKNSARIGKCLIDDLPANLPRGTPVDVLFRYESDGLITVKASLPAAGRQANLTIDRAVPGSGDKFNKMQDIYAALGLQHDD